MASELEELRTALDRLRASVLRKLTGLSDADARRSTAPPSGTNIAGLVQHLTFVESLWFEEIVSGGSAGKTHDLRWAILSVLEETARHAGHADIIREQIDGRTGR